MLTPICSSASPIVSPSSFVSKSFELVERLRGANQNHAAARHDAFFNSRASRVHRIFNARLLLFEFGFRGCADANYRDAADEFRQPLLQFFAVIV